LTRALTKPRKGRIDVAFAAGMLDMHLNPERARCRLGISRLGRRIRIGGLTSKPIVSAPRTNSRSSSSRFAAIVLLSQVTR